MDEYEPIEPQMIEIAVLHSPVVDLARKMRDDDGPTSLGIGGSPDHSGRLYTLLTNVGCFKDSESATVQ